MFRRLADALLFHSAMRLTSQYEAARLQRAREETKWREYDEPTYLRRVRKEMNDERRHD